MKTNLLLAVSLAAMLSGTVIASAQDNPPGANQQDRGIREDLSKPGLKGGAMPDQNRATGRSTGTVGQGQPGPKGQAEPPGGRYQDEKNNEEVGKPPQGGR
jgi:opacity protein-like surface antigen